MLTLPLRTWSYRYRFPGRFCRLQQCLQVGVVYLVEEVNGGFLVLVGAVDQDIKVVAALVVTVISCLSP